MSKELATQLSDDARHLRQQHGRRFAIIADRLDIAAITIAAMQKRLDLWEPKTTFTSALAGSSKSLT